MREHKKEGAGGSPLICGDIEIPPELIEARDSGQLVVFVGAGVSYDKPSGYPTFDGLVSDLSEGTFLDERSEEPDRKLGRLAEENVEVHQLIREYFTKANSHPNALHKAVLRLFDSAEDVRVVTTNYDLHLSRAASEVFPSGVDEMRSYAAPALPRGDDFRGIVYLHGKADDAASQIIATDKDFGRAYLTQGWARQFVEALYEQYAVLFVGYSHSDVVATYLARGLSSTSRRRFALTASSSSTDWHLLDVEPIKYEAPDGDHSALQRGLCNWVTHCSMKERQHINKVRECVSAGLEDITAQDESYLSQIVRHPQRYRYFARYADTVEWLNWIAEEGLLRPLFDSGELSEKSARLAVWFVDHFVVAHPDDARRVVRDHGGSLNPQLVRGIASEVSIGDRVDGSEGIIGKWVPLLVASRSGDADALGNMLDRARQVDDVEAGLLLFEALLEPQAKLGDDLLRVLFERTDRAERPSLEVESRGDAAQLSAHYCQEAWEQTLKPALADIHHRVETMLTSLVMQVHSLFRVGDATHEDGSDSFSNRRDIAEKESPYNLQDLVVHVSRDFLEWKIDHQSSDASRLMAQWANSGYPVLERLALYGLTYNDAFDPEEMLDWVAERGWAYERRLDPELDDAFANAYRRSDEAIRKRLLDYLETEDEWEKRVRCRFLHRLREYGVKCPLLEVKWRDAKADAGDPPSKDPGPKATLPGTVSGLTSEEPERYLDELLSAVADEDQEGRRGGAYGRAIDAASASPEWGFRVATLLRKRGNWKTSMWDALLRGWGERLHEQSDTWFKVVDVLGDLPRLPDSTRWLLHFLDRGLRLASFDEAAQVTAVEELSDRVWKNIDFQNESDNDASVEPLKSATRVATMLAMQRRAYSGKAGWGGLSDASRARFAALRERTGEPLQELLAENLGKQTPDLHKLDASWTRQEVLPQFDFDSQSAMSAAAWRGLLDENQRMHSVTPALFRDLAPHLEGAVARFADQEGGSSIYEPVPGHDGCGQATDSVGEEASHLCAYLSMAVRWHPNLGVGEWLDPFIWHASPAARLLWTTKVTQRVFRDADASARAWAGWVPDYWNRRIRGVPRPISACEMRHMLE